MKKNVLIIFLGIFLMSSGYAAFEMTVPAQNVRNIEIEIPRGATFRQVVDILSAQKLIRDKKVFLIAGRLGGADRRIRAGYYSIWDNMSPLDILRLLRSGQIIEYKITVHEGDSLAEIADAFAAAGIGTGEAFLKLSVDPQFLSSYHIDAPSFEGYLFPDTYKIPKGVPVEEAVGLMIDRMAQEYSYDLRKKAEEMGMDEKEVLTLASIIEKEAVEDSERPLISAVYHNRLKTGMPLQADPTAVYGVKNSGEKITKSDLLKKTPYNTYVIKGLPPGPIASPGLKSIRAALYPAAVPYLYFVSRDNRFHQFSTTISEHMNAVRLYRERQEEMKNGTPGEGSELHGTS
jgi:UPF0755 protein